MQCSASGEWDSSDANICNTATSSKRATPVRQARQDRHAAIGETKVEREAAPVPTWSPLSCTAWGVTCAEDDEDVAEVEPQPSAQPSAWTAAAKPPTERDAAPVPTWSPLSCTAWGVTCAEDDEHNAEAEPQPSTQPSTSAIAAEPPTERDAAPVPTWSPLSCTARGVTCAEGDEQAAESSVESSTHVEAPKPPTEREPAPAPTWSPLSCTAWGVTCAKDNSSSPQDVVPSATTLDKLAAAPTSGSVHSTNDNPTPTEREANDETSSSGSLFARFISALRNMASRNAAAAPTWSPLSCTAWGVTCANSNVSSQAAAPSVSATGAPAA